MISRIEYQVSRIEFRELSFEGVSTYPRLVLYVGFLVLYSALRGFLLGTLVFSSSQQFSFDLISIYSVFS